MDHHATIVKHFFDAEHTEWLYALATPNGKSFLDTCMERDPYRARLIARTAQRIFRYGITWARTSKTLTRISGVQADIEVFETRVKGGVIRIATYVHSYGIPIYLFDFNTHSGSRNNLPAHHIKRAITAAKTAANVAAEYDFTEYQEHAK